jgi:hypothetical protein
MTREEFIEAHCAECRRFFEILAAVEKTWREHRISADNARDDLAVAAARILGDERATLQERIKAGALVVLGFDR